MDYSKSHLPLLYNIYLNCIFNNSHYDKVPFKQTIQELAKNHEEYTILVPPSYVLQEAYDPATSNSSSKVFLKDLCYNNEEFIRSHIIRSSIASFNSNNSSKNQLIVYNTLNSKQILLKNGQIFTGRGFKKSLRLNILGYGNFNSFCDYFPKGSKFMLIFIEDSLIGSNFLSITDYMNPKFINGPSTVVSTVADELSKTKSKENLTFEMLLRSIPLLSRLVSEQYYKLFHHNNRNYDSLRTLMKKRLAYIKEEYHRMVDEAYTIILESIKADNPESEKTYQLIKSLLAKDPQIDLNKLIYEYVEMNMYDKLWAQILFQFNYSNEEKVGFDQEAFKYLTQSRYNELSCVSLNQLDIPIENPWNVNIIIRRISLAIAEFAKLSDSSITSLAAKRKVITETVKILTEETLSTSESDFKDEKDNSELVVDADTLVGMLIMVIVHSKVNDLEAHLYYIKNFSLEDQINDGYFNYIMSNLDAVIFHLSGSSSDSSDLKELIKASQSNYVFWAAIQKQNISAIVELLEDVDVAYPSGEIPTKHFLRSRNINGESCLMFAIKTKRIDLFNTIIDFNVNWFSIEDILFDKNTTTGQNLLMVSLANEANRISSKILDIIEDCCDLEEKIAYLNLKDILGKSVGHYLFQDLEIMKRVGHLIDWNMKDNNFHTPLFSMCRCYDHPDYVKLISVAFECCYNYSLNKGIDFEKHLDKNGNTLLHVILKGLKESLILDEKLNLVDVNQLNNKCMNPLNLYVKYNRVTNLEEILNDKRLNFLCEEPKNFYTVFDYLSFLASKPTANSADFKKIESLVYSYGFLNFIPHSERAVQIIATNAKFDSSSKDWVVFFRFKQGDGNEHTEVESMDKIKQMIQLFLIKNPLSAFPSNEQFWMNFTTDKQTLPAFSKYRVNRLLKSINIFLQSLSFYPEDVQESFISSFTCYENKKKLAFEVMKEVSKNQEIAKKNLGDVMLTNNQISEIEVFLKYSLQDLKGYTRIIGKWTKILSVLDIKSTDIRSCFDRLLVKLGSSDLVPYIKNNMKFTFLGEHHQLGAYTTLFEYLSWVELSSLNLIEHINKIIKKLNSWREVYEKIRGINNELRRYENKANIHSHEVNDEHAASEAIPTSPTDLTIHPSKSNGSESTSFFNFGIENKKSRYRRLLLLKAEEVKQIMNLNSSIKLQHETMAMEISQFFKFRSGFLIFATKQFTNVHLISLRQRHLELVKLRQSV